MKSLKGEVDRLNGYLEQLQGECGVGKQAEPAEKSRLERLKEEISALQDAVRVLEGEEIPTV